MRVSLITAWIVSRGTDRKKGTTCSIITVVKVTVFTPVNASKLSMTSFLGSINEI
jgi:hypothetical protein